MLYNLFENRDFVSVFAVALLAEGVDRNSFARIRETGCRRSPSSRRAWIEIRSSGDKPEIDKVALLAEGVDRNNTQQQGDPTDEVALLAEGVDRNYTVAGTSVAQIKSPSSRRAWIEIFYLRFVCQRLPVALLAEGVDRNFLMPILSPISKGRPPRGGRG